MAPFLCSSYCYLLFLNSNEIKEIDAPIYNDFMGERINLLWLKPITEEEYQMRLEAFGEQLKALEEQRKQDRTAENRYAAIRLWLDAFKEHAENGDLMNDDDGSIMKALVETIVVKEESMEIRFKCGVTIEREYVI